MLTPSLGILTTILLNAGSEAHAACPNSASSCAPTATATTVPLTFNKHCVVSQIDLSACTPGTGYNPGTLHVTCDLGANTGTLDSELYAATGISGSTVVSFWGTGQSGHDFCCEFNANGMDLNVTIVGSDQDDTIALHNTVSGTDYDLDSYGYTTCGVTGTGTVEAQVNGGLGDDLIIGSNSSDSDYSESLKGFDGADTICALDGDDYIEGDGPGSPTKSSDRIDAGAGNDEVNEGPSSGTGSMIENQIYGGDGDDTIVGAGGGNAFDHIMGGEGEDNIRGQESNDVICGGDDDDELYGEQTQDTLHGGSGVDLIDGGGENSGQSDVCYFDSADGDLVADCETVYDESDSSDCPSPEDCQCPLTLVTDTSLPVECSFPEY